MRRSSVALSHGGIALDAPGGITVAGEGAFEVAEVANVMAEVAEGTFCGGG
jgi:hypothetical protein